MLRQVAILVYLFLLGAFSFAQMGKDSLKVRHHSVGIQKSLLYNRGSANYRSATMSDIHIRYAYHVGKRWRFGLAYSYLRESYARAYSYQGQGGLRDHVSAGNYDIQLFRVLVGFEAIRNRHFVLSPSVYVPFYAIRDFSGTTVNGVIENYAIDRSARSIYPDYEPGIEIMLDMLYPIDKHFEAGLTPYIRTGSWLEVGLYGTLNYRF